MKKSKKIEQFEFVFNPAELSAMALLRAENGEINDAIMALYAEERAVIRGLEWRVMKPAKAGRPARVTTPKASVDERRLARLMANGREAAREAARIRSIWESWKPACMASEFTGEVFSLKAA